jgi:hypothetical protein
MFFLLFGYLANPQTPLKANEGNGQLMTVILTNGSSPANTIQAKTVPTPTTIAKTIKINQQLQQQQQPQQIQLQSLQQQQQPQQLIITQAHTMVNVQNDEKNKVVLQQQQQQQQQQQHQQQQQQPQQFISTEASSLAVEEAQSNVNPLPNFGHILAENSNVQLPAECTVQDVLKFEEMYSLHCQKIFDQVCDLKSNAIESIWKGFWRASNVNAETSAHYDEQLSMNKFYNLCAMDCVVDWVKQADFLFYQFCVEILIPDVTGVLPQTLVSSIRSLGKNVEQWMSQALVNMPERMRLAKMNVISTFSMTLRRYTSLNHLAQTVKNSMHNTGVMASMLIDLNKVDFNYIKVNSFFVFYFRHILTLGSILNFVKKDKTRPSFRNDQCFLCSKNKQN